MDILASKMKVRLRITLSLQKANHKTELNFTTGHGREAAQKFYKRRGAEIYDTNFFRLPL